MFDVLLSNYTEGLPIKIYSFFSARVNTSYGRKINGFAERAKYDPYPT